eukprot:11991048-Heterocapsa_arctica.AAC.1
MTEGAASLRSAATSQRQLQRRQLLEVAVGQRAANLKLPASEDQADGLARERPHEDLHAAAQAQH